MFVQIEPNDEMKKILKTYVTTTTNNDSWVHVDGFINGESTNRISGWGIMCGELPDYTQFIPTKIIYNPPTTICLFPDNQKIIVRCAKGETFSEEEGVMAAIIKKIFPSRNAFKKLVESGYHQLPKED